MLAKYDGICKISGQPIVANESEIVKHGGAFVLAEFANHDAMMTVAQELAAEFPNYNKVQVYYNAFLDCTSIARLGMLRGVVNNAVETRQEQEAHHDEWHEADFPHPLCRKCQIAA